jgi:muramoyltetrapeptide carboxypeptidase
MNRKAFLSGVWPLALGAPLGVSALGAPDRGRPGGPKRPIGKGAIPMTPLPVRIPPYLQAGDLIGICCGSGHIDAKEVLPSQQVIEGWGFKTVLGQTIGRQDGMFGGTDAERTKDIQDMLDNPEIKAILFARGGYGMVRIIDDLDFRAFNAAPKWLIGFSDVTVIHSHVHARSHVATIHSKMCNSFPDDFAKAEQVIKDSILSIRASLTGEVMRYSAPPSAGGGNRYGSGEGLLIGGNLRTMENLSGTVSDIDTTGKILFIEDVEEYYYNLDRMLWNFRRTGKLSGLKGLVAGGFVRMMDDEKEPFGKTHYDIITSHVRGYGYPVCFDFPVGHQKENYALRCGVEHRLEVTASGTTLTTI